MASTAIGLFAATVLSHVLLGGTPDVMYVDGHRVFVALSHGEVSNITVVEFYVLVMSLPLAMTGLLVHVLLEHRWRWRKQVWREASVNDGE